MYLRLTREWVKKVLWKSNRKDWPLCHTHHRSSSDISKADRCRDVKTFGHIFRGKRDRISWLVQNPSNFGLRKVYRSDKGIGNRNVKGRDDAVTPFRNECLGVSRSRHKSQRKVLYRHRNPLAGDVWVRISKCCDMPLIKMCILVVKILKILIKRINIFWARVHKHFCPWFLLRRKHVQQKYLCTLFLGTNKFIPLLPF